MPNIIPTTPGATASIPIGDVLIAIIVQPNGEYEVWIGGEFYQKNMSIALLLKLIDWIKKNNIAPTGEAYLTIPGYGHNGGELKFR